MESIFNDPEFNYEEYFPIEEDFKRVCDAYKVYKVNNDECELKNRPDVIARFCTTPQKLVRKLIVSIIIHWDELSTQLKSRWAYSVDDLKKIISIVNANIDEISTLIDKYTGKEGE